MDASCGARGSRDALGDTLIVFTSDNGGERYSYNWPFRGEKGFLWEGGIRVPTIVAWRGVLARGQGLDQLAMSMDWLPTLLASGRREARLRPIQPMASI